LTGEKCPKLYLTYLCFLRVVHAGGLLGWCLHAHGGDPDRAEGWSQNEGGDGSAGGPGDGIHRGPHPVDGDQPRTARCAVPGGQVRPGIQYWLSIIRG
jgi:hypothetical protein